MNKHWKIIQLNTRRTILMSLALTLLIYVSGCNPFKKMNSIEKSRAEIIATEHAFAEMAARQGLAQAFSHFAAEDAVLNRNDVLIKGKEAIRAFYEKSTLKNVRLLWSPDFADVATSGDLGYTYGQYTFTATDADGKTIEAQGIFHTVWKKQADGSWRYVWD